MEVLQLICEHGMKKLEYHHFATSNELKDYQWLLTHQRGIM